jgi:hypothetical protein
MLLSGDGTCEEGFSEEDGGEEVCREDGEQQNRAQEEREEEHQAGRADEPVLAGVYAGAGEGSWRKGELQAEDEADR